MLVASAVTLVLSHLSLNSRILYSEDSAPVADDIEVSVASSKGALSFITTFDNAVKPVVDM